MPVTLPGPPHSPLLLLEPGDILFLMWRCKLGICWGNHSSRYCRRDRERASEVAMRKDDLLDEVSATLWPRSLKRGSPPLLVTFLLPPPVATRHPQHQRQWYTFRSAQGAECNSAPSKFRDWSSFEYFSNGNVELQRTADVSEYKHRHLTDFSFLRFSVSNPVVYDTSCVGGSVVLDVIHSKRREPLTGHGFVFHETQIARTVRVTERFVMRHLAFGYLSNLWWS